MEKGQATAKQCQACHTFEKGGPNRVGPNLWSIVGGERGEGRNGFNFSAAMKAKGGKWTYDELNKFLANPREYIPGTAMTFAGLSRDPAAGRRDRLPAHAVRQSSAVAEGGGSRSGARRWGGACQARRGAQGAGACRPRRRSDRGVSVDLIRPGLSPAVSI